MKLQPADQITADGIPTHAVTRKHPTTGYNHTCKLVSHVFTYPISFGPLILGPFLSSSDEIMVSPSSTPGSAWSLWSTPPSWPAEFVWWRQSTWPKSAGSKYIHGFSPDFTQVTVGKGSSGFLSTTRIAKWLKWDLLTDAWDLLTDVLTHESNECPWVSTCQKPLLHLGCMIISTDQLYLGLSRTMLYFPPFTGAKPRGTSVAKGCFRVHSVHSIGSSARRTWFWPPKHPSPSNQCASFPGVKQNIKQLKP